VVPRKRYATSLALTRLINQCITILLLGVLLDTQVPLGGIVGVRDEDRKKVGASGAEEPTIEHETLLESENETGEWKGLNVYERL
jgi:hypothetical protein